MKALAQFDTMLERKDFDNFFGHLNISENDVLQWAVKKAQLMELTPDQQAAYNQNVQERNRLYQLERQNQDFQEESYSMQVQTRTSELEQELSRPEVLSVAESFNSRLGDPTAFRAEVIKRGQLHALNGNDISVEQAVSEVVQMLGGFPQQSTPQGQQLAPANNTGNLGGQPQATIQNKPPVIPNVGGQGTSPAKKVVRSLDDIRALSKQMNS
jgi:hypothetical protein